MEDCPCSDRVHVITTVYSSDWMTTLSEVIVTKCNACGKEISVKDAKGQPESTEEFTKAIMPELTSLVPDKCALTIPQANLNSPQIAIDEAPTIHESVRRIMGLGQRRPERNRQLSPEEINTVAASIIDEVREHLNNDSSVGGMANSAQRIADTVMLNELTPDTLAQLLAQINNVIQSGDDITVADESVTDGDDITVADESVTNGDDITVADESVTNGDDMTVVDDGSADLEQVTDVSNIISSTRAMIQEAQNSVIGLQLLLGVNNSQHEQPATEEIDTIAQSIAEVARGELSNDMSLENIMRLGEQLNERFNFDTMTPQTLNQLFSQLHNV